MAKPFNNLEQFFHINSLFTVIWNFPLKIVMDGKRQHFSRNSKFLVWHGLFLLKVLKQNILPHSCTTIHSKKKSHGTLHFFLLVFLLNMQLSSGELTI